MRSKSIQKLICSLVCALLIIAAAPTPAPGQAPAGVPQRSFQESSPNGLTPGELIQGMNDHLTWNTFLGSSLEDDGQAIAIDGTGAVFVVGNSSASWGTPLRAYSAASDIFVAKIDANGVLQWNTFLGGSQDDEGYSVELDGSGNIYISGSSAASWGSPVRSYSAGADAFIARLDSNGVLQWNTFLGGSGGDYGFSVALHGNTTLYTAGFSDSAWGTPVRAYTAATDAFVAKLDSDGAVQWNTFLGGGGNDYTYSIALDGTGNPYVAGDGNASWGTPVQAFTAGFDAFAARLDPAGALQWNTFVGGSGGDYSEFIIIDNSGAVALSGYSDNAWGTPVRAYTAGIDGFAARLNSNGELLWNTFLGSSAIDYGEYLAVDASDNIYLSGTSGGTWGNPLRAYTAGFDAYTAKIDSSGVLHWNTFIGGSGDDSGYSLALDGSSFIYQTGASDAAWGAPVRAYTAGNDAFIAKIPLPTENPPGAFGKSSPSTAAAGVSVSPTMAWTLSSEAASYEYCYDTSNDNLCAAWVSTGANTSVGLSDLSLGTTYYWQVRAKNPFGVTDADGAATAFWSFTTGDAPGTYGKLSPSNAATDLTVSPTLSWTLSSEASSYEYCYDTSNDNLCTLWIDNGTNTSAGLSGLSLGTTYYWQVRANNGFGVTYANSAETAYWSFTTGNTPASFSKSSPSNAITGVSLTPILAWTASSGVSTYEYCYDASNDNDCTTWVNNGVNTSVSLSGLSLGTTYYWQARAINGFGETYANGAATAFWSFTTGDAPVAFGKSSPLDGAVDLPTSLALSWTASSGASSYEYCYDTSNDNLCAAWVSTGANTSAALSGLSLGTTYYWQVRSINGFGVTDADGAATAYWSFSVSNAPGSFTKLSPADLATSISYNPTISWAASSGATSYEYCFDASNDNACAGWVDNGPATSANLGGLTPGTTYYWQVRANNSFGVTYADLSPAAYWRFTTLLLKFYLPIINQ